MTLIAGVDACVGGWLCLTKDTVTNSLNSELYSSSADLIARTSASRFVMIDIPIGLSDGARRACDNGARKVLGMRACCVFDAPVRAALNAQTREEASTAARNAGAHGVGSMAWGIYPKVKSIDSLMTPKLQDRINEIHPEICFWAWNGKRVITESKKEKSGQAIRQQLIAEHFGANAYESVVKNHPRSKVADDDIADAFAALWTADRRYSGTAVTIPQVPIVDANGLRMEIWY